MRRPHAFTLLELLVVIAVIAALTAILLPALGAARKAAQTTQCLANIRNMELAHWNYLLANKDQFIRAGLGHGGSHANEPVAWINTLQQYYGSKLVARSPLDTSPHWAPDAPGLGVPIPPSTSADPVYRRTSYGINSFLDTALVPWGSWSFPGGVYDPNRTGYYSLGNTLNPSRTVHFVVMAFEGDFAGADHPHPETWAAAGGNAPTAASAQLQINAARGSPDSWDAVSNYGFLDGHAETLPFHAVYTDAGKNLFDPMIAR